MIENLTDEQILEYLRRYDETVTREFFYDTCRMAYRIDDQKYGLRYKQGMEFFSIAHDYYLRLCNNNWRQLEKRDPNISLVNWTINGFHYLVREQLKTYGKGMQESLEERTSKGEIIFDTPNDNTQQEVRDMIEEICHSYYRSDRKSQSILRMILIMGMKGKEVAEKMGITPSAVSQRFRSMMDDVVRPFFVNYYSAETQIAFESIQGNESYSMPKQMSEKKSPRSRIIKPFDSQLLHKSLFWSDRITPTHISQLGENEIFVFGSDLRGIHCGGSAYQALRNFGAQLGVGSGPQGRSYAIPTIVGGLANIRPYIEEFEEYASNHPEQVFLVTPIGCGIAGFTAKEIAPLFIDAIRISNIHLPEEFWQVLS